MNSAKYILCVLAPLRLIRNQLGLFYPNLEIAIMAQRTISLFLLLVLIRCGTPQIKDGPFEWGKSMGVNRNHKLEEASGLVASSRNPGMLWSHNDSGNPPEIFLIDSAAVTKKIFTLSGIRNRDWEDIARGPGPVDSVSYLYVGDIGDNQSHHNKKYIYRFPEPSLDDPTEILKVDTLTVTLEDGALDTEALMIDPVTKNLYLVSKREKNVRVYEIAYPFGKGTLLGKKVCTLPVETITGGDISPDGMEVLLKNYEKIFYWKKTGDETLIQLLMTPPTELPYHPEPQGEGIAWALNGSGFYTLSENAKGERAKLYFYKRK